LRSGRATQFKLVTIFAMRHGIRYKVHDYALAMVVSAPKVDIELNHPGYIFFTLIN
jgi:hypothetical protein